MASDKLATGPPPDRAADQYLHVVAERSVGGAAALDGAVVERVGGMRSEQGMDQARRDRR